jgi:protein-serine/threonine kinase
MLTVAALANIQPPSSGVAAPQSLRRLFHDETSDAPDPFRSYGQAPGSFSSISSTKTANLGDVDSDGGYDPRTLKRTDYAARESPARGATYRDVRDAKGLQPISIPLGESSSQGAHSSARSDGPESAESSQQATPMPGMASSPTTRRFARAGSNDNVGLESPRHVPGQRRPSTSAVVRDDFSGGNGGGLRAYRSDASASSSSLQGLEPPNRPFAPTRPSAPSLQRLHSAAPTVPLPGAESPPRNGLGGLHPRPAMTRQASVAAIMERTEPHPISPSASASSGRTTPMFAAGISMMRTRSGSRTDGEQTGLAALRGGGLGLKDVLKVSGAS